MKNGTYEEWYINGKKKSKYNYQDNLKHGRYTTYYQNGKKKEKGFWKHGNNEGLCSFWFENGQQKKEGVYKNTKGIGLWTYWYPNGNIEREGYRNNGIKMNITLVELHHKQLIKFPNLSQHNSEILILLLYTICFFFIPFENQ